MNLLRSICGLFWQWIASEASKATKEASIAADLGQDEAELEKSGKEQMSHMEGTSRAKTSGKNPA